MPPEKPLNIRIVMFPGVQVLDVTGPLEVFALANRLSPGRAPALRHLGAGAVSPSLADSSVPGTTAARKCWDPR
jgi:transcriptional regulator GlxA family with amidase domain